MKSARILQYSFGICIFLVVIILLMPACKEKKPVTKEVSSEVARIISQTTGGMITSGDGIRVIFTTAMISGEKSPPSLDEDIMEFEPGLSGSLKWEDTRTLLFQPEKPLRLRQVYEAKLNFNRLFPGTDFAGLEPLFFNFQVGGREIRDLQADFELVRENDPQKVYFSGQIYLTENIKISGLESACSAKLDGKELNLDWTKIGDEKSFHFRSDDITRGGNEQELVLTISAKTLDLSADFEQRFRLPAVADFKVVSVSAVTEGDRPYLVVEFSDQLKSPQDLRGFLTVQPSMDLQLQIAGKKVLAQGDFTQGESYSVQVQPGIRSRWGTSGKELFSEAIIIEDMKPEIRFANDGVFMPSVIQKKVLFQTLNVKRVQLKILRVFESNLGQFLQMDRLNGARERREDFHWDIEQVGLTVVDTQLSTGNQRNEWLQHELDLRKLIRDNDKGLYLIGLRFEREDMLYNTERSNSDGDYDYYNNPSSYGYLYYHGRVLKPVIMSDIGLIYKKGWGGHYVYATDLLTARPLAGVQVKLKTYQHQIVGEGATNSDGMVQFPADKQDVFYIEAEKNNQRSAIRLNEMAWNTSTFDTKGVEPGDKGVRAFIFTERGVYRPGDPVNISVVIRNDDNTFPENHPVILTMINPRGQAVHEQVSKEGIDGFYNFRYNTKETDLTGKYQVSIKAGSETFTHEVRIETVMAERLKVDIGMASRQFTSQDRLLKADIKSNYLFGNPASLLDAEVTINLQPVDKTFDRYNDFRFSNFSTQFDALTETIFEGRLNEQGEASLAWAFPTFMNVPSALKGQLIARVIEKGGRASRNFVEINIDPYPYYVGIKAPDLEYSYARTGQKLNLPVVIVDPAGTAQAGRTLYYRIYRNERRWWWEYDSQDQFRLHYKSDRSTELQEEGRLISAATPVGLNFTPEKRGNYLIEVQDGHDGHISSLLVSAYPWGETPSEGKEAGILALRSDKEEYAPGDKAVITFPAPSQALVLVTVEKGGRVLSSEWQTIDGGKTEQQISIPVSDEMLPTAYVSVALIQPHAQTANDRPIRLYGMVPLNVRDAATRQELTIIAPEELRPRQDFEIKVQTADHRQTQLTIAVVDEGLLNLTRHKTPDPWMAFYQKQRLAIETFDLFNQVLGVNKGDIFQVFSIGGDMEEMEYRRRQMMDQKAKRFEPVCLFKGPLMTDEGGLASIRFTMPEYVGSVRIMAVSAKGNRYGNAEKSVPVKSDLMVMPTLPRVLSPNDRVSLPVTVFAMRDGIGSVNVSVTTEGPVEILGEANRVVSFNTKGDQDVMFELKASAAVGVAKIKISASAGNFQAKAETEIAIRASSPTIRSSETRELKPGETVQLMIPDKGLPGTNEAVLSIMTRPHLNLGNRLHWLIQYPYGCIEQTTSAVFPQLYLKSFIPNISKVRQDINSNINEGIRNLRNFQLADGSFTYWPGARDVSDWGTIYAGHFMVEAKKLGYYVPDRMYNDWLRYLQSSLRSNEGHKMVRVYGAYVLALAGSPVIGAMNLLRENYLDQMSDTEKSLLAGAYRLIGQTDVSDKILEKSGVKVKDYLEFSGSYGSGMRDKAILLEQMTLSGRWQQANLLAEEIALALSRDDWYSTQTTGYMLLALGKYFRQLEGESPEKQKLSGKIILPGQKAIEFETAEMHYRVQIESGFGQEVTVQLNPSGTVKRAFAVMEWSGKPITYAGEDASRNLNLSVEWLDDNGLVIDPSRITQGKTFWLHMKVDRVAGLNIAIDELALVQILPSGWEIENVRLSGENQPEWMRNWRLNREEYLDIRDDRAMWFFDLLAYEKPLDFVLKLSAVTVGEFSLPPAQVEAMYNNIYSAMKAGKPVVVTGR